VHQGLVEFEQRCGLDKGAKLCDPAWAHEQHGEAEHKRSIEVRFGARCRERLLMSSWCFSNSDSAATARKPPGRTSFANVTSGCMTRIGSSRMKRTGTITAHACKTARRRPIASHYEFATHRQTSASVRRT
jgi:hypothetical protein